MLHAANILIDREPARDLFRGEGPALVARVAVAIKIPGRIDERIHRVALASPLPATLWAPRMDEGFDLFERRSTRARDLYIERQQHRQIFLGHRHDAARLAVNHRNRSAPIALPRDAPIFNSIG